MKQVLLLGLFLAGLTALTVVAAGAGAASQTAGPALSGLTRAWDLFGDRDYEFSEMRQLRRVASKIADDYVDPARIDGARMLDAALDRAAREVPQVIFDYQAAAGTLRATVGADERSFQVGPVEGVKGVTRVLTTIAPFLDEHLREDSDVKLVDVEYSLINGMLSTLDPHSVFIAPDDFKEMQVQNKGKFGGLGITIGIRERRLTILYPLRETPAWKAGLRSQDRIIKIGEESTINMGLEEAVDKLRGDVGTPVRITVDREGEAPREYTLVREEIKVPSVKYAWLGGKVGYLKMLHFAESTADDMDRGLAEMAAAAGGSLSGLVLDLRDNPGGYLQQAVLVADRFIDQGVIVTTVGHGDEKVDEEEAHKYGTDEKLRLVVLVDQGSASASEIVAGAIQNHDRGVVLGARTFGKGSVQNLYEMEGNSALKLTIARYLTPGRHSIQSVGIVPDIGLRPGLVEKDTDLEQAHNVRLYWQDQSMRESDLDEHFESDAAEAARLEPPTQFVYDATSVFHNEERGDREEGAEDWKSDVQVQVARTILEASNSPHRQKMLEQSRAALDQRMAESEAALIAAFHDVGIDWTAGEGGPGARAEVTLTSGTRSDGVLRVGEVNPITLTVRNVGDAPFVRLRAMADSELLGAREFVFGRVGPGQSRSSTVAVTPGLYLNARADALKVRFHADGSAAPPDYTGRLQVAERPRPRFAYAWQVVDDGTGKSRGNGDGLVQAGEAIDLLVTVRNIGDGPTGDDWARRKAQKRRTPQAAESTSMGTRAVLPPSDPDGAVDEKAGFVQLKSKAGDAVFLTDGTGQFSLDPGQQVAQRLHFDVRATATEPLKLQVLVGDNAFYETFVDDLSVPVHPPSNEGPAPVDRLVKPRERAAVRAGAAAESPVVAWFTAGTLKADGRLHDYLRVVLPGGAKGWVAEDAVTSARAEAPPTVDANLDRSPPVITVARSGTGAAVEGATLQVEGSVADDAALKDLYVFVNGKKVFYRSLADRTVTPGVGDRYAFSVPVPLEDGANNIELLARDRTRLLGSTSFGVYRNPATHAQASAR